MIVSLLDTIYGKKLNLVLDLLNFNIRKRLTLQAITSAVILSIGIIADMGGGIAQAEHAPDESISYAYASWIGTGYYKFEDQNIFVLRGPFSYTLRETDSKNWGLIFLFPVTLGINESFSIWGFGFNGFGIDYTHGDGFTGIGLTTGFPF